MKVTTMGQQPRAYSIHVYPAYPGSFLKIINKILDQKVCLQEDEVGFPAFLFSFSVLVLPLFFSLWFVLPRVIKIENNIYMWHFGTFYSVHICKKSNLQSYMHHSLREFTTPPLSQIQWNNTLQLQLQRYYWPPVNLT